MMENARIDADWIDATAEEYAEAEAAALAAANAALADFDVKRDSPKRAAQRILLAFAAVEHVKQEHEARIKGGHKTHYGLPGLEPEQIVASAVAGVSHPRSVAGAQMVAFASACRIIDSYAAVDFAHDCQMWGYADRVLAAFVVNDEQS